MHEPKISRQVASLAIPVQQYNSLMAKHEVQPEPGKLISFVRVYSMASLTLCTLRCRKVTHQAGKPLNMNYGRRHSPTHERGSHRNRCVTTFSRSAMRTNWCVLRPRKRHCQQRRERRFDGTSGLTKQNVALHLSHRNVWLNRWGREWRNLRDFGQKHRHHHPVQPTV